MQHIVLLAADKTGDEGYQPMVPSQLGVISPPGCILRRSQQLGRRLSQQRMTLPLWARPSPLSARSRSRHDITS